MTKQQSIWAASKLLQNIYPNNGDDSDVFKLNVLIIEAEFDENVDFFCSALDKVIELCETLKKGMYNQE